MFLIAILFGTGFYHFTVIKAPNINLQETTEVIIPQPDIADEVDVVKTLLYFHASDYFVYRGVPIGFQYEMLREMEKGIGKNVSFKIETDASKIKKELFGNNYDIIVMDFIHSGFLLPLFEFSLPHSYSYPVLVFGKKDNLINNDTLFISSDFSAKIFFTEDSPYGNFIIQREKYYSTEELFEKVDNGEISYLICDYNQAITLMPFYSNVQILDKAGPQFERRWLLNKRNVQLNEDITHWLLDFKKTAKYRRLIQKYFSSESSFIYKSFAKKKQGDISQYDEVIEKYAKKYGFDWRFVASIIYQETKFTPGLTGKGGSFGLMQLMPVTMEHYGISETDGDEANICAGIQHLNSIRKSFEDIGDEDEKLYFIAASYNAGRGHIFDAQRLCTKYEGDYKKWSDVSKYLLLKSHREIVADPLVKSGYFPGSHTVKYTQQVMERYAAYKVAYP
jgi:membrane-bound lytic murein transglycosylase F